MFTGPVRRGPLLGTQRQLSRWFRQRFPSSGSDVANSAVHMYPCRIRSNESSIHPQGLQDH